MTGILERIARARPRRWGLVAAGALMTLLLAQIVLDRIAILRDGVEVRLATAPVDPRDIFRGDYVILTYDISRLPLDRLGVDDPESYREGETVYVGLEERDSGRWGAAAIARAPEGLPRGTVPLRGRIDWIDRSPLTPVAPAPPGAGDAPPERAEEPCARCRNARLAYGLESYFVPEGEGKVLEDMRDEQSLDVIVAIGPDGDAAIKGLILDGGAPIYEEPLI